MHFQRKVASGNNDIIEVIDNIEKRIADIEIINIAKNSLIKDADTFVDMITLNTAYNNFLGNEEKFHCYCKRHIKSLLLQKLSDVQFLRPKLRRQAEIFFLEAKRDQTWHMNAPDTYKELFVTESLILRDIRNKIRRKFTESYDVGKIPTSLEQFLK